MDDRDRYAIGQQDFRTLRQDNALYVDKTPFVDRIVRSSSKFYFLARPRRFGKSLFLSTLRYFFEGRRELFRGLYIATTDWDWQEYPVLYLDLNSDRYAGQGKLDDVLDHIFRKWERKYDVEVKDTEFSQRFRTIIESAHSRTGRPVVILVDEYDKPLVGNLDRSDDFEHYRTRLASLYSNFKSAAEHLRLVFLTGLRPQLHPGSTQDLHDRSQFLLRPSSHRRLEDHSVAPRPGSFLPTSSEIVFVTRRNQNATGHS